MIKICTDLNQSTRLRNVLPIDTADAYWEQDYDKPKAVIGNYLLHNQCMEDKDYKKLSNPIISPAWTMHALIDILGCCTLDFSDNHYCRVYCKGKYSEWYESEIDGCVEIIERMIKEGQL